MVEEIHAVIRSEAPRRDPSHRFVKAISYMQFSVYDYDLVILDVILPHKDLSRPIA